MTSHALTPEQAATIKEASDVLAAHGFGLATTESILRDLARTLLEPLEKERDVALAAMKRLPEHLKECEGRGPDDPPCVALLAYEEVADENIKLHKQLEEAQEENTRLREQLKTERIISDAQMDLE